MSDIIASPFSYGLPHYSLFSVPKKNAFGQRPPNYFWEKAIAPVTPAPATTVVQTDSTWLDDEITALSDSEDENTLHQLPSRPPHKKKTFARIRQIAFRAFVPKAGSNKSSTVVSTEIVAQKKLSASNPLVKNGFGAGFTLFNSWRIQRKGGITQVRKLTAVFSSRVSSRSPEDQKPKTWEQYNQYYAAGRIDVTDPPLPPMEPSAEPTPYDNKIYMPPNAEDESTRQLLINRLGVFGKSTFDSSEEATEHARARTKLAEKLEREDKAPKDLQQAWTYPPSEIAAETGLDATFEMKGGYQTRTPVPETLEQHPVFRKIVKQCREMFDASISMLSIMEAGRQIFLAELGLDGLREAPRGLTVCSHTVLSGRKGFTVLDTLNDWRFSSSPLVMAYGARFYAGVPLMTPNLDGSPESERAASPLGTLCVLDNRPRESFGIEERKKLVYMAEYARREIALWFKSKMEQKVAALEDSHKTFNIKLRAVEGVKDEGMDQEVLTEEPEITASPVLNSDQTWLRKKISFGRFGSSRSLASMASTTPSLASESAAKPSPSVATRGPSLFDDTSLGMNPKIQKIFEMATMLVGSTLDLSLVYLLAVEPQDDFSNKGRTLVLAEYNLLAAVPSSDTRVYRRVLSTPEGGLIYQNPGAQEIHDAALMPVLEDGSNPYASAILVRVGPAVGSGGIVLAGFTTDEKHVFGAEDLIYMTHFADELTRHTCELSL